MSDKAASDVGGLKTTYPGNPFDYYERIEEEKLPEDTPLFTKQCIYNKSGFIIEATWYNIKDIVITKTGNSPKLSLAAGAKPFQTDIFPTLQGRCASGHHNPLYLAMSVRGGEVLGHLSAKVAKGLGKIGGLVVCLGISDAECQSYNDTIDSISIKDIPGVANSFYFDESSTNRYVDVWGTAYSPQAGPGGPVD